MRRFHPAIEAQRLTLDPTNWERTFVIGDVHGCRSTLERLLATLEISEDDLVVFVGDLVRRGPDNHGVVEIVRDAPNMYSVRGNNEAKIIEARRDPGNLTVEDVDWIRSLPVVISWDETLVVHAGVDPRKRLSDQSVADLLDIDVLNADGDWWERYDGDHRIVFGHEPLEEPLHRERLVGIDTGCVYGGSLTAYDWRNDRTTSVDVDPAEVYDWRY
ncbi:metallophosphoesterase family protein [Natrarchaeobius oligotrophus]|uniref:Serine/threonine protein phosphatase n=1 Tax=Natrarchaeobius chitinivorans TaxID=1679083 RepID=A0A3N6NRH4_NATCH|nr:metallophosphoesterase family protein [Natrarchaeobius chitinivorans]RQH02643.1 serine/threonine protein phosphatase [Natrarchaeobius chitinivorans]